MTCDLLELAVVPMRVTGVMDHMYKEMYSINKIGCVKQKLFQASIFRNQSDSIQNMTVITLI